GCPFLFFFQAEDGIRDFHVTGVQTCTLPICGFETPSSGEIFLDGKPITKLPPNKRNVNIVFQDYALFPHLSVGRNIAFGLELKRSEERRVGKEWTAGRAPDEKKQRRREQRIR